MLHCSINLKKCTKCEQTKDLACFSLRHNIYRSQCKKCRSDIQKEYKRKKFGIRKRLKGFRVCPIILLVKTKQKRKEYRKLNKDKILITKRMWKTKNKSKVAASNSLRDRQARFSKKVNMNYRKEIKIFYTNKPINCQVDHIIPLKHKLVCGLHVPWNLQILTSTENNIKNNKFDGTYENNSWKNICQ